MVVVVHAAALVGLMALPAVRVPEPLPERLIEVVLPVPVEPTVHAAPTTTALPTTAAHHSSPPTAAGPAPLDPAPVATPASPGTTEPAAGATVPSVSTATAQHSATDTTPAPAPATHASADTQPATDANYLCAAPAYPDKSARLHESGRVVISLVVEADGSVSQAAVKTSSGFARLDEAARSAVSRCRFRPGTRNGVPQAMPYEWLWTFGSKDH